MNNPMINGHPKLSSSTWMLTLLLFLMLTTTSCGTPTNLELTTGTVNVCSAAREGYVRTVLRLTGTGSFYFLRCFVKSPRQGFTVGDLIGRLEPGEVEQRFGGEFDFVGHPPVSRGYSCGT